MRRMRILSLLLTSVILANVLGINVPMRASVKQTLGDWDFPRLDTLYMVEGWPWPTALTMAKECRIDDFIGMISTTVWDQLQPLGWMFTSSVTGFDMCYMGFNCRSEAPPPGGAANYHGRTPGFPLYPLNISSFRLALQYIIGCEKTTWLWEIFRYINVRNDICVPPANMLWRNPYIPLYEEDWSKAYDILIENGFTGTIGGDDWIMPNGQPLKARIQNIYVMSPAAPTSVEVTRRHVKKWNIFFTGVETEVGYSDGGLGVFHHDANVPSSLILNIVKYNRDHDIYFLCWSLGRNPDYLYDFFHPDVDVYGGDNTPGLVHEGLDRLLWTLKYWKFKDYEILDANVGDLDELIIPASTHYTVPWSLGAAIEDIKIERCHKTGVYFEVLVPGVDYTLTGTDLHILRDIILYPGDALEVNYIPCTYHRLIVDQAELVKVCYLIQWKLYYLCPYCPIYSRDYIDLFKPGLTCWVESRGYGAGAYQLPWTFASIHWQGQPVGGSMKWHVAGDISTLNPIKAEEVYEMTIQNRIYEGLITINPYTHTDMPWIALKWDTIPWVDGSIGVDNGMIIKFWLRDDVYWQNGDHVTAEDIKWNFDYIAHVCPDIGTPFPEYHAIWSKYVKSEAVHDYLIEIFVNCTGWWKVLEYAGSALIFPEKIWGTLTTYADATAFNPWAIAYEDWTGLPPPPDKAGLSCLYGTGPYYLDLAQGGWNGYDLAVLQKNINYWARLSAIPSRLLGSIYAKTQASTEYDGQVITKVIKTFITAAITNLDTKGDCNFTWELYLDTDLLGNGSRTLGPLENCEIDVTIPSRYWPAYNSKVTIHDFILRVSSQYGTTEHELLAGVLIGDVNNDDISDLRDGVAVAQHYGETGPPCWIPMDINNDGKVDIKDLIIAHGGNRDIAVTNVATRKTVIGQGYILNVDITVQNQGSVTETFNASAYYDGNPIPVPEQWPNSTQLTTFWSQGDVNKNGYIDYVDLSIIEENYGWIGPPGGNPADINSDGMVNLSDASICSQNSGKNIWTELGIPGLMKNKTSIQLSAGNSALITFKLDTTSIPKGNYTISANVEPLLGESDTGNNMLIDGWVFVTIPGDANGDRICDFKDITAMILAFNAKYRSDGKHRHASPCDLCPHSHNLSVNCDGIIDFKDITIAILHYPQKW